MSILLKLIFSKHSGSLPAGAFFIFLLSLLLIEFVTPLPAQPASGDIKPIPVLIRNVRGGKIWGRAKFFISKNPKTVPCSGFLKITEGGREFLFLPSQSVINVNVELTPSDRGMPENLPIPKDFKFREPYSIRVDPPQDTMVFKVSHVGISEILLPNCSSVSGVKTPMKYWDTLLTLEKVAFNGNLLDPVTYAREKLKEYYKNMDEQNKKFSLPTSFRGK